MKPGIAELLLCPRCYRKLKLDTKSTRGEVTWEGELTCGACGSVYPLVEGIALLSVIDRSWGPMIRELLSRVEVTDTVLFEEGFEKDRQVKAERQHETSDKVADRLFDAAVERMDIGRGTRILDVGAGTCETSAYFADLGAEVVATDVELAHLMFPRFFEEDPLLYLPHTMGIPVEGTKEGIEGMREGAVMDSGLGMRMPVVRENYFSRFMSDVHRLPFQNACFEITFCRSTIHHLEGIPLALREMARVTRPGGRVVLASEPVRSILDPEIDELGGIFDYQQGLNERKVPVFFYTVPLRCFCGKVEVDCFVPYARPKTEKLFGILGVDHGRLFGDGERLGFGRSFKLLFTDAGVNVLSVRSSRRTRKPARLGYDSFLCEPGEVVPPGELSGTGDGSGEGRRVLLEYRDRLRDIYRRTLNHESLPFRLDVSKAGRNVVRKGFRGVEFAPDGSAFRYTHRSAVFYLRNDPTCSCLNMGVAWFLPEDAGRVSGTVYLNSRNAGTYLVSGETRSVISLEKPPEVTDEEILEVEIHNDDMVVPDDFLHNGDDRELGVAITGVWQ